MTDVSNLAEAVEKVKSRKARGKGKEVEVVESNTAAEPVVTEVAEVAAPVDAPAPAVVEAPAQPERRNMKNMVRHEQSYKPLRPPVRKIPVPVAAPISRAYKELWDGNPAITEADLATWLEKAIAVSALPGFAEFAQQHDVDPKEPGSSIHYQAVIDKVNELYEQAAPVAE